MAENKPKNTSIGSLGEELACRYLMDKGYKVLERNYTNNYGRRLGEIDIVAFYKGQLVFVEVKTRIAQAKESLSPEANINRAKLVKLQKIVQVYLREQRKESCSYRFDAVSILYDKLAKKALIKHIESIFI